MVFQSQQPVTVPSTMLDFAMKPEEALSAPLNTTKLAPVTVTKHKPPEVHICMVQQNACL